MASNTVEIKQTFPSVVIPNRMVMAIRPRSIHRWLYLSCLFIGFVAHFYFLHLSTFGYDPIRFWAWTSFVFMFLAYFEWQAVLNVLILRQQVADFEDKKQDQRDNLGRQHNITHKQIVDQKGNLDQDQNLDQMYIKDLNSALKIVQPSIELGGLLLLQIQLCQTAKARPQTIWLLVFHDQCREMVWRRFILATR